MLFQSRRSPSSNETVGGTYQFRYVPPIVYPSLLILCCDVDIFLILLYGEDI
jgi:hypothetical protein